MANYPHSQPSYGMPFTVPPPNPQFLQHPPPPGQQQQQHMGQGGPPDLRQTHHGESYQYNSSLPGLNLPPFPPSIQQAPHPYWAPPPQHQDAHTAPPFPPPFSAQTGLPPPPPPGASGFYPPAPPPPIPTNFIHNPAVSAYTPPAHSQQPFLARANERIAGSMDSEKEEGELSEGDQTSQSPAGARQSALVPPRSVPTHTVDTFRRGSVDARNHQHFNNTDNNEPPTRRRFEPPATSFQPSVPVAQPTLDPAQTFLTQMRGEACSFVQLLHDNNMGYPTLAAEGLDPQQLQRLFHSMNLSLRSGPAPVTQNGSQGSHASNPLSSAITPPPPATGTTIKPISQANTQSNPPTKVKTSIKVSTPVKSTQSPIERQSYLAQLQAARSKPVPSTTNSSSRNGAPEKETPHGTNTPTQVPAVQSPATKAVPTKERISDEERARKTELVRQKLEAMNRARQAASTPVTPQAAQQSNVSRTENSTSMSAGSQMNVQAQNYPQAPTPSGTAASGVDAAQPPLTPSFSGIPGLFMTGSAPTATPFPPPGSSTRTAEGHTSRKRPLASDFDEAPYQRSSAATHPQSFGRSPSQQDADRMVIGDSDDQSEGSEMDLDETQDTPKTIAISQSTSAQNGTDHQLRYQPPLSDLASRPASTIPFSSAISTPPTSQTTADITARKNELEREMQRLKTKIAEARAQKKQDAAKKAETLPPSLLRTADSHGMSDESALLKHPPLAPENGTAIDRTQTGIHLGTPEIKRRERAVIESELSALQATMAKNESKMIEFRKALAELEESSRKALQDKERLVKELEGFGIDTEGMAHDELKAKKHELDRRLENGTMPYTGIEADSNGPRPSINAAAQITTTNGVVATQSSLPRGPSAVTDGVSDSPAPLLPEHHDSLSVEAVRLAKADGNIRGITPLSQQIPSSKRPTQKRVMDVMQTAPTNPSNPQQSTSAPDDSDEDFYSPQPAVASSTEVQIGEADSIQNSGVSVSKEGDVEMPQSFPGEESEDEYEPEELNLAPTSTDKTFEPETLEDTAVPVEEEYEPTEVVASLPAIGPSETDKNVQIAPAVISASPSSITSTDNDELYKPSQPSQGNSDGQVDGVDGASTEDGEVDESDDQGAMDISASSSDISDSDRASPTADRNDQPMAFSNAPRASVAVADDLALELQPNGPSQTLTVEPMIQPTPFVPYESPLKMFKSYRFHPHYLQEVANGYSSMTYSHQIDPHNPLCDAEAAGRVCNNPNCSRQHFGGMSLPGQKLLLQLGTANPGETEEERRQWNDDLKIRLQELRQQDFKDPNRIADEIVKFRRQFVKDDFKFLALDMGKDNKQR